MKPFVVAGVDWITLTNTEGYGSNAHTRWEEWASSAMGWELGKGKRLSVRGNVGTGWEGGSMVVGPDLVMLTMIGAVADFGWRATYPYAGNVTRIDLQVTVSTGRSNEWVDAHIRGVYDQHLRDRALGRIERMKARLEQSSGEDGSATFYGGSRASERMLRIYNKSVQAGLEEKGIVRYELQLRDGPARAVARMLYDVAFSQGEDALGGKIAGVVLSHLERYSSAEPLFDAERVSVKVVKAQTEQDGFVRWLNSVVIPACSRYEKEYGAGAVSIASDGLIGFLKKENEVAVYNELLTQLLVDARIK